MKKTLSEVAEELLEEIEEVEMIIESRTAEEKLWHAVIALAFEDEDVAYFKSDTFEEHCNLLKMDVEYMRESFLRRLT